MTIKKSFKFKGVGLFSGEPVEMICEPYDLGIVFEVRGTRIPATVNYIDDNEHSYTTTLINGKRVRMTEHILSAFYGLGVNNVLIKLDKEEVPFTVNSRPFVDSINKVGVEGGKGIAYSVPSKKKFVGPNGMFMELAPHDGLFIKYILDYPNIIGSETSELEVTPKSYEKICDSRTYFSMPTNNYQYAQIRKNLKGLPEKIEDCDYISFDQEFINPPRENEISQHKIADMIGDLSLLGVRLNAKITAYKTGHWFNRYVIKQMCG